MFAMLSVHDITLAKYRPLPMPLELSIDYIAYDLGFQF